MRGDARRHLVPAGPSVAPRLSGGRGKVVLIDVSGLGSTEEVLVASYLTRRVLEEWQSAYLDHPEVHERMPVVAVVLEEAQRVLGANKDRESNVFPVWPVKAGSSTWGSAR